MNKNNFIIYSRANKALLIELEIQCERESRPSSPQQNF